MTIITKTFDYEGGVRIAEVPPGTKSVTMHLWGGAGGGGGEELNDGGVGSAGHYVTKTDLDMTSYAGVKNISVSVGGGGQNGTQAVGAEGGTNGKSLTAYSGGQGGPSGTGGVSGSGGGGGGATVVTVFDEGAAVTQTVLAIAGGGAGGGGGGRLSSGGKGSNTNNATARNPGTLGENGASHQGDGAGAGAGGGGADGGTGGSGDRGDIGAFGGRAGSNTVPAGGSEANGSDQTPGGTTSGYYATGVARGGDSSSVGGNGRAVLIFDIPGQSYHKVAGAHKQINKIYNKVSGTWKNIVAGYYKVSGVWKNFFTGDIIFRINYALFGDAQGNPTSGTDGQDLPPVASSPDNVDTGGEGDGRVISRPAVKEEWSTADGPEDVYTGFTYKCGGKQDTDNPRVICTYFYQQGELELNDLECDYRWTQQNVSDAVKVGYWYWAIPLVDYMESNQNSKKLWHRIVINTTKHFAKARAQEISYKMGGRKKGSIFGKVVRLIGEPLCAIIGTVIKPFTGTKYDAMLKGYKN